MGANNDIDQYVINKVRDRRKELGIPQTELSIRLGLAAGFVGLVETAHRREKYNIQHLNRLAIILKCSPKDFLPDDPFPEDVL